MTIQELIDQTSSHGTSPIIGQDPGSKLDARLILCHILEIPMEKLLAELRTPVDNKIQVQFFKLWTRRLRGTPIAYITGVKEFYGRDFFVDPRVLIPRPDTEILVETVLSHHHGKEKLHVHDCCTGSGCIAITLGLEEPTWKITASDISFEALEVAKKNLSLLQPPNLELFWDNLLTNLHLTPHIITANPPYLTELETEERLTAGWKEPELALKSGNQGLEHIESLIIQASQLLKPGGYLYIEGGSNQAPKVRRLLKNHHFLHIESVNDLSGLERVTYGHL